MSRRRASTADRERWEHARREKLGQLHEQLTTGVADLMAGDQWQAWLSVAKRFHRYSFWNTLAIFMQCPEASQVAGYKAWQAMGRQVRKGECGIAILAPVKRHVTIESEAEPDGREAEAITLRRLTGFTTATVFDISQTDGEPIPEPVRPELLTGDGPTGLWDAIVAQITAAGHTVEIVGNDKLGPANGRTHADGPVWIRDDLDELQRVKTLAHEQAHIALGHLGALCTDPRSRIEVEAESVAYLVMGSLGFDTASYSFPYVAGWAQAEPEAVKEVGVRVVEVAHEITAQLSLVGQDAEPAAS